MVTNLINLFCVHCSRGNVEESSWENFKLIKNTLPNKSENPENLKNNHNS